MEAGAENEHRDRREEARQRQPQLERRAREHERWGPVAPDRVGHEAASLDEVARDDVVVRRVLGRRERDGRRDEGADDEREDEQPAGGEPGLPTRHGRAVELEPESDGPGTRATPAGATADPQRVSPASTHTG